jgi:hypothetical protein
VFDFLIVVISTVDIVLEAVLWFKQGDTEVESDFNSGGHGSITTVFRIFRLLRVFKIAKSWTTFNYFLSTILITVKQVGSFSVLLCLFIFTFTILGMELFSNTLRFT